jgi:hypothetical protein
LDIGVTFRQQTQKENSVPDGIVAQQGFKLVIETKNNAGAPKDQLKRHLDSFTGNEEKGVLILLSKEKEKRKRLEEIRQVVESQKPSVEFHNLTFEEICKAADGLFGEHEEEMQKIVEDFIDYCDEEGLNERSKHLMRIVPCGKTWKMNLNNGVYFQPSSRGYSPHQYIGIYHNKEIKGILDIKGVFDADYDTSTGELKKQHISGEHDGGEFDEVIKKAIKETDFGVKNGHRFFCGHVYQTSFIKASPYGVQGARFKDLKREIGDFDGPEDAAKKMNGKKWY